MGNLVSGANVGRNLSSAAGLNIPGAGSRLNLTGTNDVTVMIGTLVAPWNYKGKTVFM